MNLKNLIQTRIEKNISQKEIATYLNVSKGTYSAWESGSDTFPLKKLNALCSYLDISFDYAFNLSSYHPSYNKNELNNEIISERLKNIRQNNHLTLTALAKKLNTSASVLSRYENAKTMILTSFVYAYAKLFNISIDYLLGKTSEPKI